MKRPVDTQMPATKMPSKEGSAGAIRPVMTLGDLGATVNPLMPSNNPGSITSPSAQGPVRPGTQASKTKAVDPQ